VPLLSWRLIDWNAQGTVSSEIEREGLDTLHRSRTVGIDERWEGLGFAPSAGESLVLQADVDVDLYRGLRARYDRHRADEGADRWSLASQRWTLCY
jgi:hypothetical protein